MDHHLPWPSRHHALIFDDSDGQTGRAPPDRKILTDLVRQSGNRKPHIRVMMQSPFFDIPPRGTLGSLQRDTNVYATPAYLNG